MTDTSSAVTPAALDRLQLQATGERESAARQLALTPYEYGDQPIMPRAMNPTTQDRHPSAQRLASGQWNGYSGQVNHAQAAQDSAPVWVTVPVDKVETRASGAAVAPVYASPTGYRPRPGESAGSIPPPVAAGRPLG